jgi:hypothetical protein
VNYAVSTDDLSGGYSVLASCHYAAFSIEILKKDKEYLQFEAPSQKNFWFTYTERWLLMPNSDLFFCVYMFSSGL